MAPKIRVGIVGATVTVGGSGWGARTHVPALHALPEYQLKAVCTAHEDTALASQKAFGTDLAFHNFDDMVACPEIDLITVVTRVPTHYDLVMRALGAGKALYCEWPLGATLEQAEHMADLAAQRKLYTAAGLQARSDPTLMYARELIEEGYIGEVLAVDFAYIGKATTRRGNGRIWQSDRKAGANILTIGGGHAIDALSFVLGDFSEVSARLATTVTEWLNTDTGQTVPVDSPDWVSVSGQLRSKAEVSFLVAAVPALPDGRRTFEIYGREGTLSIGIGTASAERNPSVYHGPNRLFGARGKEPLTPMETPARFTLIPDAVPAGPPRNVAQAYVRLARAMREGRPFDPDFAHAVKAHKLIGAIKQSSAAGTTVSLAFA
ncbi:MAG: Gfo/Idh/MocA family oxidoreductase [Bryobacteraceae bacterium]|jgi:predicted dehydrogenase